MTKHESPNESPTSDIDTRKLLLTLIRDETGSEMREHEFTLPEWQRHMLTANADSKVELCWQKGARFGKSKSDNGSYRTNANLKSLTAVMVEYDKPRNGVEKAVSFDEAVAIIKKAGLRALAYTSPSHKESEPRWRAVFPLSAHVDNPKLRHEVLVAESNELFNGQLAPESFTLSQGYYVGSVKENPDHRVEIIDGDFIDLRDDLFAKRIYKDGGSAPRAELKQSKAKSKIKNVFTDIDSIYGPADKAEVKFALNQISSDNYLIWMKGGAALANEFGDEGFELFEPWSAESKKYHSTPSNPQDDSDKCKKKFADFAEMTEIGIGYGIPPCYRGQSELARTVARAVERKQRGVQRR